MLALTKYAQGRRGLRFLSNNIIYLAHDLWWIKKKPTNLLVSYQSIHRIFFFLKRKFGCCFLMEQEIIPWEPNFICFYWAIRARAYMQSAFHSNTVAFFSFWNSEEIQTTHGYKRDAQFGVTALPYGSVLGEEAEETEFSVLTLLSVISWETSLEWTVRHQWNITVYQWWMQWHQGTLRL